MDKAKLITYGCMCLCPKPGKDNGTIKITVKLHKPTKESEYETIDGSRELFIESFPPAFKK